MHRFGCTRFPIADLGALAQSRSPLGGLLTLEMSIAGMRSAPTMRLSATADTVRLGTVRVPRLDARATYAARRLNGELRLLRDAQPAINVVASLPVDLALAGVEKRLVNDSLRIGVRADSVDLALLQTMVPNLAAARGRLQARFDIGGRWTRPTFAGGVDVRGAEIQHAQTGMHLRNINGRLSLSGDSIPVIRLDSLVMASGPHRASRAYLAGTLRFSERPDSVCRAGTGPLAACLAQRSAFDIRFRAENFEAIRQRRLAELEVSGNVQLSGAYRRIAAHWRPARRARVDLFERAPAQAADQCRSGGGGRGRSVDRHLVCRPRADRSESDVGGHASAQYDRQQRRHYDRR